MGTYELFALFFADGALGFGFAFLFGDGGDRRGAELASPRSLAASEVELSAPSSEPTAANSPT